VERKRDGLFNNGRQGSQHCVTLNAAGDDFRIIDPVIKALRHAGIPAEEIETFCDEAMSGGDRELLWTCGRWVTLAQQ
jgi:hypothetical protein